MTGSSNLPRKVSIDHLTQTPFMTPNKYQQLASRTICPQDKPLPRLSALSKSLEGYEGVKLLHAVIGLTGEVGELAGAVEKYAYYGQPLDETNIKEELGDILWYVAEACEALDIGMADVMEANIRKLRLRFPDKYTNEDAKEENRDRQAEAKAIEIGPDVIMVYPNDIWDAANDRASEAYRRAADDGVNYEKDEQ